MAFEYLASWAGRLLATKTCVIGGVEVALPGTLFADQVGGATSGARLPAPARRAVSPRVTGTRLVANRFYEVPAYTSCANWVCGRNQGFRVELGTWLVSAPHADESTELHALGRAKLCGDG